MTWRFPVLTTIIIIFVTHCSCERQSLPDGFLDLEDQSVTEGGTARFSCNGSGPNLPQWSLEVDGMKYQSLHRDAVGQDIRRHKVVDARTLVVSNVDKSDNGSTYQCTYLRQGYCTSKATLYIISNQTNSTEANTTEIPTTSMTTTGPESTIITTNTTTTNILNSGLGTTYYRYYRVMMLGVTLLAFLN